MPKVSWSTYQTLFDYTLVNGAAQILYLGRAEETVTTADPFWTIHKFNYLTAGDGTTQISGIEVLGAVAWDNRASLPWT